MWYQLIEFSIKFDTVSQDGPLYILRGHSFNFPKNIVFIFPCRRQSKMILTIDEHGSKLARNFSIVICHQSGDKWQSETLFLPIFYLRLLIISMFSIPAYLMCSLNKVAFHLGLL